jgi:AI-2 transport protein TqsA
MAMDSTGKSSDATRILVTAASFVVLVAGMKAASSILVPFLLSLFIAIICVPPLFWMVRKGVPNVVAVISILIGIVAMGFLLAAFMGNSINAFSRALPAYETRLSEMTAGLVSWLESLGLKVSRDVLNDYFDPGKFLDMAMNTLTRVRGLLTNAFLILLTVIFIMLEASAFPQKLQAALKDPEQSLGRFREFTTSVNRYLAMKTLFSFATGLLIWIWLSILGVDFPLLWGLLAFLFNYVPNIGSIIAAIPALLLSLIQYGMGSVLFLAFLGYVVVNVIIGSILEPKLMGRGLGLSTLVVFLSLVFWGWVLGPVGMLLSVLLTMIVKIALESNEETRWLAILLG